MADKLNAVVVDEDDHKYLLPSDLMNPSWANSSPSGKTIFMGKANFKTKIIFLYVLAWIRFEILL